MLKIAFSIGDEPASQATPGEIVRCMREKAKLTQSELARRLKMTQARLSQIENDVSDKRSLTCGLIARIAIQCGFTPSLHLR